MNQNNQEEKIQGDVSRSELINNSNRHSILQEKPTKTNTIIGLE